MISVILAASDEAKQRALAAGFVEQTVLVRYETLKPEGTIEGELMRTIKPSQFIVGNYWGAGPE
jgi:hypothetical protein